MSDRPWRIEYVEYHDGHVKAWLQFPSRDWRGRATWRTSIEGPLTRGEKPWTTGTSINEAVEAMLARIPSSQAYEVVARS